MAFLILQKSLSLVGYQGASDIKGRRMNNNIRQIIISMSVYEVKK
jgi:hypothetical protein